MASYLGHSPEKLTRGVSTLATCPGNIKERLTAAYIDSIQYVKPANVPQKCRPQLAQIHKTMRAGNGTIVQAVNLMTINDTVEMAQAIFGLYDSVTHATYEGDQGYR